MSTACSTSTCCWQAVAGQERGEGEAEDFSVAIGAPTGVFRALNSRLFGGGRAGGYTLRFDYPTADVCVKRVTVSTDPVAARCRRPAVRAGRQAHAPRSAPGRPTQR